MKLQKSLVGCVVAWVRSHLWVTGMAGLLVPGLVPIAQAQVVMWNAAGEGGGVMPRKKTFQ